MQAGNTKKIIPVLLTVLVAVNLSKADETAHSYAGRVEIRELNLCGFFAE